MAQRPRNARGDQILVCIFGVIRLYYNTKLFRLHPSNPLMQGGWYLQLRALVGIKVHSLRQQVRKERVELLAIRMKIRREAPLPDMSLQVVVEDSGGIAPVSR